jgi:hypothetical protein
VGADFVPDRLTTVGRNVATGSIIADVSAVIEVGKRMRGEKGKYNALYNVKSIDSREA